MVERLNIDSREVVQMPLEDYNEIMGFIQAEKQKKDDYYKKRIEMAERYLEGGKPGIDPEEMMERCFRRAEERRRLRA
ncbi:MAG: hypothetical protein FWH55_08295 [Oscillospiraceae bacterium]|nr:hypothetical protein [Oscillospiraceae bacterium]